MADYWIKFGENKTVNKVVVRPSPRKPSPKKIIPKKVEDHAKQPSPKKPASPVPSKTNDTRNTSKHYFNPFNRVNNSNIESFNGQNFYKQFSTN